MSTQERGSGDRTGQEIAIIGVAVRAPGARDVGELWENLVRGREALSELTSEELREAGVSPDLAEHPSYVRSARRGEPMKVRRSVQGIFFPLR